MRVVRRPHGNPHLITVYAHDNTNPLLRKKTIGYWHFYLRNPFSKNVAHMLYSHNVLESRSAFHKGQFCDANWTICQLCAISCIENLRVFLKDVVALSLILQSWQWSQLRSVLIILKLTNHIDCATYHLTSNVTHNLIDSKFLIIQI